MVEADLVMIQPSRELWAIGSRDSPFFSPGRMMVGYSSALRTQSIRVGLQQSGSASSSPCRWAHEPRKHSALGSNEVSFPRMIAVKCKRTVFLQERRITSEVNFEVKLTSPPKPLIGVLHLSLDSEKACATRSVMNESSAAGSTSALTLIRAPDGDSRNT